MISMKVRNAPKVAVSEKETERSFVNSCASRSYRTIPGFVTDQLDDEREDWDGKDERREQQVELRDGPDGHAASDDGEPPVLRLLVGLVLGLRLRVGLLGGRSLCLVEHDIGSRFPVLAAAHQGRGRLHGRRDHHEGGDETEKDQQFAVHHRR